MNKQRHAEIAGSGIAGLMLATMLARGGWSVTVHERAAELREIGSGIFLKNNSVSLLEETGIFSQLEPRGERLRYAEIYNVAGRQLQRRELRDTYRVYNFPRQAVVDVLRDAADEAGAQIVTSSEVMEASPQRGLRIEGGSWEAADLVVGADGHRSVVRESLGLTKSMKIRPTGAIRLLIPRTPEDGVAHTTEHWAGGRRVGIAACTDTQTYVYMSGANNDPVSSALPIDIPGWQKAFPGIAHFFDRLQGQEAARHPYSVATPHRWSSGNIALIGDAAHALPPTLGQGAGLSIMNAFGLARTVMRHSSVSEALGAWEREFRPTSDATQRWALRYDALTEFWPPWLASGRSAVIWAFGRSRRLNARMRVADAFRADLAVERTT